MHIDTIFDINFIEIDKSQKRFAQKSYVHNREQSVCDRRVLPGQEIWFVIMKSIEPYQLWIKCFITKRGMNIAIWERIADNFKIEIIYSVEKSHMFGTFNSNAEMIIKNVFYR